MDEGAGQVFGPIRVAVAGALGSMGLAVCSAVAADSDLDLVAAVDLRYASPEADLPELAVGTLRFSELDEALVSVDIDVVVDFTLPATVFDNVVKCLARGVSAVVGTSGLGAEALSELDVLARAAGVAVFVAPNFALGAVLAMQFAEQAASVFSACEIVELHHDKKVDAPSGTARRTAALIEAAWAARGLDRAVPIHSVRLPGLVAHQEVVFGGSGETLTLRHDSLSRESFMAGVLLAVKRVAGLQGLVVGLEKIL